MKEHLQDLKSGGRPMTKLEKANKEIERLKEDNEYLNKVNIELSTKKNRLNNIINELEKWLKEKQILYGINQQGFSWGVCGEALDKLQELKGSDK